MATPKPVIQYSITFPPDTDDGLYESESFSIVENSGNDRPVIILLGWAGCIDKHLAKYSDMYEQKRYITIRYTAPTKALFFTSGVLKELAEQVLELLFVHQLERHPIFFHIFSNGGCFIYRHASESIQINSRYTALNVRGCIIDSAPGKRRILKAVEAFMLSVRLNFVLRYLLGFCLLVYLTLARLMVFLFARADRSNGFFLFEALCEDKNLWPQLVLYSKADQIIMSKDVAAFIASRQGMGVVVDSVCWESSPHVSHFVLHREAYINKCLDFVSQHLKGKKKNKSQ